MGMSPQVEEEEGHLYLHFYMETAINHSINSKQLKPCARKLAQRQRQRQIEWVKDSKDSILPLSNAPSRKNPLPSNSIQLSSTSCVTLEIEKEMFPRKWQWGERCWLTEENTNIADWSKSHFPSEMKLVLFYPFIFANLTRVGIKYCHILYIMGMGFVFDFHHIYMMMRRSIKYSCMHVFHLTYKQTLLPTYIILMPLKSMAAGSIQSRKLPS